MYLPSSLPFVMPLRFLFHYLRINVTAQSYAQ